MLEYIENAGNEKRVDVVLLEGECFEPGQLEIALKLLKKSTGMWGTEIFPIMFAVHNEWYPEEETLTFIGLETADAMQNISQKDLMELAKKWRPTQRGITEVNGKRVIIRDYLWDTEGGWPEMADCDWKSDEYVKGWNACLDEVFNSGME